jgi:hypothetical protein
MRDAKHLDVEGGTQFVDDGLGKHAEMRNTNNEIQQNESLHQRVHFPAL